MNYTIIYDGVANSVSGTSASAPTFASIVALLNDALISAGKPALGFLNPLLYSKGASAFTDITTGESADDVLMGCANARLTLCAFLFCR